MDTKVLYLPLTNTYPNALHVIPAPNAPIAPYAHNAPNVIDSGISDGKNDEQLNNEEVIPNYNDHFCEGSEEIVNNFKTTTESSIVNNLSHTDLEAVTVQLSGEVAPRDMGNHELENTPQKPSASEPDQIDPEKYLNNDAETLRKVINNPVFYKDTQHLKIDQ